MGKRIKWHYSAPSMVFFGMASPEEVEDKGDVAIPTQQSEGCFTYVLWPQGALYNSEQEALGEAVRFYEGVVADATGRLKQLTRRLTQIATAEDKPASVT